MSPAGIEEVGVYTPNASLDIDGLNSAEKRSARVRGADEDRLTFALEALQQLSTVSDCRWIACSPSPLGIGVEGLVAIAVSMGLLSPDIDVLPVDSGDGAPAVNALAWAARVDGPGVVVLIDFAADLESPNLGAECALAIKFGHEARLGRIVSSSSSSSLSFDRWFTRDDVFVADSHYIRHKVSGIWSDELRRGLALGMSNDAPGDQEWQCFWTGPSAQSLGRLRSPNSSRHELKKANAYYAGSCAGPVVSAIASLIDGGPGSQVAIAHVGFGVRGVLLEAAADIERASGFHGQAQAIPARREWPWLLRLFGAVGGARETDPMTSPTELARDMPGLLGMDAVACDQCGDVTYPAAFACSQCSSNNLSATKTSRRGKVLTHNVDELYRSGGGGSTQMAVLELDGGGRFYGQVADEWVETIEVGDRCRLGLRRLHMGRGLPHYYWKVFPDD